MLYPVQNIDRRSWSILLASFGPYVARDLVFGSMERQNAPECPTSRDLYLVVIQTRVDALKRLTSQFRPIPGLFQTIPDPTFADSRNRTIVGSPLLHSRAIPIHAGDLDWHAGDPKARSGPSKPLKKCSEAISNTEFLISEKFLIMISQYQNLSIMRIQYQKGPVFGSRT